MRILHVSAFKSQPFQKFMRHWKNAAHIQVVCILPATSQKLRRCQNNRVSKLSSAVMQISRNVDQQFCRFNLGFTYDSQRTFPTCESSQKDSHQRMLTAMILISKPKRKVLIIRGEFIQCQCVGVKIRLCVRLSTLCLWNRSIFWRYRAGPTLQFDTFLGKYVRILLYPLMNITEAFNCLRKYSPENKRRYSPKNSCD